MQIYVDQVQAKMGYTCPYILIYLNPYLLRPKQVREHKKEVRYCTLQKGSLNLFWENMFFVFLRMFYNS